MHKRTVLEKREDKPGMKPRIINAAENTDGSIFISVYLLGPRGAKVMGGSVTVTREEFEEIYQRIK